ncbi:MAG: class I SAM-dependent methyltransferase [Sphingobacteriales bacterium]|nr:MAG: class I SAM-dependent methyltransferase [Sphingobacteriales bacterium]
MALKQHFDDKVRFEQQVDNTRSYVVPFIEQTKAIGKGTNVLEIGCGEGGVLKPFMEKGCYCVGVDLDAFRIELANEFFEEEVSAQKAAFLYKNVYDADFLEKYSGFFDLIVLKDTIEHIPDQEKFIPYITKLLKPGGQIFFGFPPWYMPFGGHQQVCRNKVASMLPYYHILPRPIYKAFLKMVGEPESIIKDLMDVVDTQITIERFERIINHNNLKVVAKQHYLINPIYRYKFGLQPRKQIGLISAIPYVRDFLTTCVYYTISI